MLEAHYKHTRSTKARQILNQFENVSICSESHTERLQIDDAKIDLQNDE